MENKNELKRELGLLLINNFIEKDFTKMKGYKHCFVIKFNNFIETSIFLSFICDIGLDFNYLYRTTYLFKLVDLSVSNKGLVMNVCFELWHLLASNQVREKKSIPFDLLCCEILKNEKLSPILKYYFQRTYEYKSIFQISK